MGLSRACTLVVALLLALPASAGDPLARLERLMVGSFSSASQAVDDAAYLDIRLHVVRIWPAHADGPWLYVEQARADALDAPYRQRVYRLSRRAVPEDEFVSAVYELPGDPRRFAAAWKEPARLDALKPQDLVARTGCEVVLRPTQDGFEGSTVGRACASSLRGAAWAASEVVLTDAGMRSWDRGFDAEGKQVWGATGGPYVFRRVAP